MQKMEENFGQNKIEDLTFLYTSGYDNSFNKMKDFIMLLDEENVIILNSKIFLSLIFF